MSSESKSQYCTVTPALLRDEAVLEHSTDFPKNIRVKVYSVIIPETGIQTLNFPCSETKYTNIGSSLGTGGVCTSSSVGINWVVAVGDGGRVDTAGGVLVEGVVDKGSG